MTFSFIFFFPYLFFILLNCLIKCFQTVIYNTFLKCLILVKEPLALLRWVEAAPDRSELWVLCSTSEFLCFAEGWWGEGCPHHLHLLFQRPFLWRIHLFFFFFFLISICKEQINLDNCVSDGRRLSHCILNKLNANTRILLSALLTCLVN